MKSKFDIDDLFIRIATPFAEALWRGGLRPARPHPMTLEDWTLELAETIQNHNGWSTPRDLLEWLRLDFERINTDREREWETFVNQIRGCLSELVLVGRK